MLSSMVGKRVLCIQPATLSRYLPALCPPTHYSHLCSNTLTGGIDNAVRGSTFEGIQGYYIVEANPDDAHWLKFIYMSISEFCSQIPPQDGPLDRGLDGVVGC